MIMSMESPPSTGRLPFEMNKYYGINSMNVEKGILLFERRFLMLEDIYY